MQNTDCLNWHQALLKPARLPRKLLFPEELGHAGKCDTFPRVKLPRIGDSSLRKLVFPTAFPKATNKIHHDFLSLLPPWLNGSTLRRFYRQAPSTPSTTGRP